MTTSTKKKSKKKTIQREPSTLSSDFHKWHEFTNRTCEAILVRLEERYTMWSCRCDCGKKVKVKAFHLKSGHTKSCGCLRKEIAKIGKHKITHNMSKTPEYKAWNNMKNRCNNPNNKDYKDYGGRGIKVCDHWLESFENFYSDMGDKPFPKILYSIDRVDNNGDYTPENCKRTTQKQQANNRRNNKK